MENNKIVETQLTNDTGSAIIGTEAVHSIVESMKNTPIFREEDVAFLVNNQEHLGNVLERTQIWRTDLEKRSILNDTQKPTLHAKFHQAILEQKVQFEQTMYLARDYQMAVLDMEELECDLDELHSTEALGKLHAKRQNINIRKKETEIQFKKFELNQLRIQMKYRMDELMGWQKIEEELLELMHDQGYTDEEIWNKSAHDDESLFWFTINNLRNIDTTNNAGETSNLLALAGFTYKEAKSNGKLMSYIRKANADQISAIRYAAVYLEDKDSMRAIHNRMRNLDMLSEG